MIIETIVADLLLKGAIKDFIVTPILKATITLIPQADFIHGSLLGCKINVSTKGLYKHYTKKNLNQFFNREIKLLLEKQNNYIYKVSIANEQSSLLATLLGDDQSDFVIDFNTFDEEVVNYIQGLEKYIEAKSDMVFIETDKLNNYHDNQIKNTIGFLDKLNSQVDELDKETEILLNSLLSDIDHEEKNKMMKLINNMNQAERS